MPAPVFDSQRGLVEVKGSTKNEITQRQLDDLGVEQMFTTDNTTTSKTVKIYAPFRLNAAQRKVLVDGQLLNIASPSNDSKATTYTRQSLHCCTKMQRYTQRPHVGQAWKSDEKIPIHRTARMRDHVLPLEPFNQYRQGE